MKDKINEEIINVRDVPTRILTWGKKLNESFDDRKEIVLCITGNPGLSGFYAIFLATLYKLLSGNVSVWVIGSCSSITAQIISSN